MTKTTVEASQGPGVS